MLQILLYHITVLEYRQEYSGAPTGFSVVFGGNKDIVEYCFVNLVSIKMLRWNESSHGKVHHHKECCSELDSEHKVLGNLQCEAWTPSGTYMDRSRDTRMSCGAPETSWHLKFCVSKWWDTLSFYMNIFIPELLIKSSGTCSTNLLWCGMLWKFFSRITELQNRKVNLLSSCRFLALWIYTYICVSVCVYISVSFMWK